MSSSDFKPGPPDVSGFSGDWLILDASGQTTRSAILSNGAIIDSFESENPAMESLLNGVQIMCRRQAVPLKNVRGFIYCSGPGSILGIRISLIAIKTWGSLNPKSTPQVSSFDSLTLAAAVIRRRGPETGPFAVVSEWRKGHWNALESEKPGDGNEIRIWNEDALEHYPRPVYHLARRNIRHQLKRQLIPVEYDLSALCDPAIRASVLHSGHEWNIYTPEDKTYVKWSKERHR